MNITTSIQNLIIGYTIPGYSSVTTLFKAIQAPNHLAASIETLISEPISNNSLVSIFKIASNVFYIYQVFSCFLPKSLNLSHQVKILISGLAGDQFSSFFPEKSPNFSHQLSILIAGSLGGLIGGTVREDSDTLGGILAGVLMATCLKIYDWKFPADTPSSIARKQIVKEIGKAIQRK